MCDDRFSIGVMCFLDELRATRATLLAIEARSTDENIQIKNKLAKAIWSSVIGAAQWLLGLIYGWMGFREHRFTSYVLFSLIDYLV